MKKFVSQFLILSFVFVAITSCSFIPQSGPLVRDISDASSTYLIKVDTHITKKLSAMQQHASFSELFPKAQHTGVKTLATSDLIEIRLWESPPAVLFGGGVAMLSKNSSTVGMISFPPQPVDTHGEITVPFIGILTVTGKTTRDVEKMIVRRLSKKANKPQAMVTLIKNNATDVAVIGDVQKSIRMPLKSSSKLIDALIAGGWVKYPLSQMSVQLTRGVHVHSVALETLIHYPKQENIALQSGDIVTALYKPLSFTALGSSRKNAEISFETKGITLAQALARSGGLESNRSDARGVYIFRYETASVVENLLNKSLSIKEAVIPVVYKIDFNKPESLFIAQKMQVKDKDLIYIAESSGTELKRFLDIISSTVFSTLSIINSGN